MAAPLFLYILVESLHHTNNKLKLVYRLFIANTCMIIATIILNITMMRLGNFPLLACRNIFGTLALVALNIVLVENIRFKIKTAQYCWALMYGIGFILALLIPILILYTIYDCKPLLALFSCMNINETVLSSNILEGLIHLIPNIINMEYSVIFIAVGIIWYFQKQKSHQLLTFLFFCIISYLGLKFVDLSHRWPFSDFFEASQFLMVLALPIMALYNGKRGYPAKYVFYIYYPLHIYLLYIIGCYL